MKELFEAVVLLVVLAVIFLGSMFFFSACNTIVITHTQGRAEDVVDSSTSAQADVSPKLDVPLNLAK